MQPLNIHQQQQVQGGSLPVAAIPVMLSINVGLVVTAGIFGISLLTGLMGYGLFSLAQKSGLAPRS